MRRDNSGLISKNDRKEKDSHPDFKGQATIDGAEYWISGWKKTSDRGPFLSLAFSLKDEERVVKPQPGPATGSDPFGDDVPF